MQVTLILRARWFCIAVMLASLLACQHPGAVSEQPSPAEQRFGTADARVQVLNRLSWGASASSIQHIEAIGADRYIDEQLKPRPALLPPAVQAQIDTMTISQRGLGELL